jgi:putative spermidine/putrescine transport system substrate-binding protein
MNFKRRFIVFLGAIAVTVAATPGAIAQDKGQVIVASWGGSFQDALREAIFKPFEKATGIKVIEAVGPSAARIRTMVNSGNPEWDVVEPQAGEFLELANEGVLQRLDYSAMDASVFADFPKDAVLPYGVGTFMFAGVITFNTKEYTQSSAPRSWADVWNVKKFPGPRIFTAQTAGKTPGLEVVLLADGVAKENLYPIDFKRAYAALSRIRPYVAKWATTTAMQTEAIASGEAVIGPASANRAQQAKEQGEPIDYVWDQAVTGYDYWAIVKGARNAKNAQKFIEFASRPESQAALAKLQPLGPLNKRAFELIPRDRAKLLPTYPENLAKSVTLNPAWWAKKDSSGKSYQEVNNAMWNEWALKQ